MVDDTLRTNVAHIFAAGDIDGNSMLVSSALLEGRIAAENAVLGSHRRLVHDVVPAGSFTDPEYGSVGLTEARHALRYDCAVAVVRYEDLLRPVADGQPEGFCKLIVETEQRQIVGAHVLGEYSAEVIQMIAACMAARHADRSRRRTAIRLPDLHRGRPPRRPDARTRPRHQTDAAAVEQPDRTPDDG